MKATKLTVLFAAVCGAHLGWCQTTALAGDVNECYGDGQWSILVSVGGYHEQDSDEEYHNVTLSDNATWNTKGYILRVRGTLTIGEYAELTDQSSGGAGGAGGFGGIGGHGAFPGHNPPCCCSAGGDGQAPTEHWQAGDGGAGGGGGGGGGGAWNTTPGCWQAGAVSGGNGDSGGSGGRGGGYVRLYVYALDNHGTIHADGADGEPGSDGVGGNFKDYSCFGFNRDAAGGGGGGGGGGDSGDGGTVEIYYTNLINEGEIHANGRAGGTGGDEGGSDCDMLDDDAGLGQGWEYGSPGCPPGEEGCGWGGYGGRSCVATGCEGDPYGQPGQDGCDGGIGTVILVQDCNCNETPDDEDITSGVSEDCQPNNIPDECDIDWDSSDDCNINIVPDECELPGDPDCNTNGILDECDLIFTASCEQLSPIGDGFPQNCVIFSPPEAVSDVTLRFKAIADLDGSDEYIDVYINGWYMGRVFESDASQCPLLRDVDAIDPEVSATWYNAAVGDEDAVITMVASSAVNADLCDPPSWITVYVIYTTDEDDCNTNLIPDECDIRDCPPGDPDCDDCQTNGVPDWCDIYWGTSLDCNTNGIPDECEGCSALDVRSCADHDDAGRLCLDMGVSNGIDPRTCAITELEVDLDEGCLFHGGVSVDCSSAWSGTAIGATDGNTLTITFDPALPDQAKCTIELDCGAQICVRRIEGDLNRDGHANTTDASQVKLRFGQPATDDNCQWDFNCDGVINTTDFSQIKLRFCHTAPECP